MRASFRTLCSLRVDHAYYDQGQCRDFGFAALPDTAGLLKNGRLLARNRDGGLHLLFEADESGAPLRPLARTTLRFGLRLLNPLFDQVTAEVPFLPLYRNRAIPTALDPPMAVHWAGRLLSHGLARKERPATVTLRRPDGLPVASTTVEAGHDRPEVSFDLSGWPPGLYRLEETYPAATLATDYYLDGEALAAGLFGIVELTVAPGFYAAPPALVLSFAAREELLRYYLVVGKYTEAEFASLTVDDAGFGEDQRPRILFDRVEAAAFGTGELSPGLLADDGRQVVLFRSRGPVARQERARRNIQLRKNGDVLIKHLPQVGAADANGDVVIHISKP
ncbi:hypothetical protein [Desulfobulbus sp.]|uniref:hypothetical protein n=1 Tax=Desulfobulbus sp. TaxID=895 RepID=UPI00286ECECA|nr:hypothetical protein [Desulfobulbus sp.]